MELILRTGSRRPSDLRADRPGARDPVVSAVELVIPQRIRRARLVAVVQIVGAGAQPRLVQVLSDTTMKVVALS
jgi:hypothetical protein